MLTLFHSLFCSFWTSWIGRLILWQNSGCPCLCSRDRGFWRPCRSSSLIWSLSWTQAHRVRAWEDLPRREKYVYSCKFSCVVLFLSLITYFSFLICKIGYQEQQRKVCSYQRNKEWIVVPTRREYEETKTTWGEGQNSSFLVYSNYPIISNPLSWSYGHHPSYYSLEKKIKMGRVFWTTW